jgi:hypothetical protein
MADSYKRASLVKGSKIFSGGKSMDMCMNSSTYRTKIDLESQTAIQSEACVGQRNVGLRKMMSQTSEKPKLSPRL